MSTTSTQIRTESLRDVAARQSVVPEWLRDMIAEEGEDAMVVTHTRLTGFGNFLVAVEAAS